MAFNVALRWTRAGFVAREAKAATLPAPDRSAYALSLNDAIRAWAMMQLSQFNPGNKAQGQGQVSYASLTPPSPRQLGTWWDCDIFNWTQTGATLDVTNVL